ncbi:hypothetical protein Ocin01_11044 [Orchesella cincta]|uniref:Uncharacterized protein n=1 Tax=Orchesella cincta TaxID=48709 RepID=A0A1D2MRD7_ORCCI|nr:hypothetical protein Ocin01_11044 [Orchesella cincta]
MAASRYPVAIGAQQQQPPPGSGQYPPQQMRSNYPPTGQSISQPTGPTPTLNQLLQPGGSAAAGGASGLEHREELNQICQLMEHIDIPLHQGI